MRTRGNEEAGRRPLYRPRNWHEGDRSIEKDSKKSSWSKEGQKPGEMARATLIICPQAGDSLTHRLNTICMTFSKEANIHIKVVTTGNKKMTKDLKSNLLRVDGCGREDCMVCANG